MLPGFATQTITRVRPPAKAAGAHGNTTKPNWAAAGETAIAGCSVQPGGTQEILDHRDTTQIQWTIYAPGGTDILATDGVKIGGVLYQVKGEPARWTSATGALNHVVILLETWVG
jgi:hypothetical protein